MPSRLSAGITRGPLPKVKGAGWLNTEVSNQRASFSSSGRSDESRASRPSTLGYWVAENDWLLFCWVAMASGTPVESVTMPLICQLPRMRSAARPIELPIRFPRPMGRS